MKRKVLLSLLIVFSMLLTSCGVVASPQNEVISQNEMVVDMDVASNQMNQIEDTVEDVISAKLAKLTKEDGTGEINLQMTIEEITNVLDKYGIQYSITDSGRAIYISDGSLYCVDSYAGYGSFSIKQSYKGLKIGDSIDQLVSLYGEPDRIIDRNSYFGYVYNTAMVENFFVVFKVRIENDEVAGMLIELYDPYEEL